MRLSNHLLHVWIRSKDVEAGLDTSEQSHFFSIVEKDTAHFGADDRLSVHDAPRVSRLPLMLSLSVAVP